MMTRSQNVKGAGRPIQYDREAAVEAAAILFYEKGFKDTSVQDVVAATGMQTGSVYAAFGSKLELFLECLDRVLDQVRAQVEHFLHDGCDPVDGLSGFVSTAIRHGDKPCFAMRALVEFPDRDSEVWQLISATWEARSEAFRQTIARGQLAGQIRSDLTPVEIEKRLFVQMVGSRFLLQYIGDPDDDSSLLDREAVLDYLKPR